MLASTPLPQRPNGGLVLEYLYASFDSYMRGRMRSLEIKTYSPPFELNKPILSHGIARVLKSDAAGYHEGDIIARPHFHSAVLNQGHRTQYPHSQSRYRNQRPGRQRQYRRTRHA